MIHRERKGRHSTGGVSTVNDTVAILQRCARDRRVCEFVVNSLEITLRDIGLPSTICNGIFDLVYSLAHTRAEGAPFAHLFKQVTGRSSEEMHRTYSVGYADIRQAYFDKYVVDMLRDNQMERVLDLGCGPGLVSSWLLRRGIASEVWGIDAADFAAHWSQLLNNNEHRLHFCVVRPEHQEHWMKQSDSFDCVMLSWVLHHSQEYEAVATLKALRNTQPHGLRVVILEDSHMDHQEPMTDPNRFWPQWQELLKDGGSRAWQAQALLDYIAVRILAAYDEVNMPFHYRSGEGWVALFREHGFALEEARFVGFPARRDIAVPQSLLSFRLEKK